MDNYDTMCSIVFTGISAGTYEFAVVLNDWEKYWSFEGENGAALDIKKDNASVAIDFDKINEIVFANVCYREDDWWYDVREDGTAEIIGYNRSNIDLEIIEIPEMLGGEKVTAIRTGFAGCKSLASLIIPEGVTSIGEYAFCDCTSLTSVTIPKSVTEIGAFSFGYAPDSDWNVVKLPDFAIYGYAGSAAEDYAMENGFTFIEITDEPVEEPTETPTEETTEAPTEETTEAPTEETTEASTEESAEVAGDESTEEPTETPTETPTEESAETPNEPTVESPSDAAITVDATGEFTPKLEMTKDEILSAVSKLLTKEQLAAVKAGESELDIRLAVANIDKSVSDADRELIEKAVENIPDNEKYNFKVMNYLDIKLEALIDGKGISVTETDGLLTVSVELENPVNGTYKVVRIHDGKTDLIDSQLSKDGKRLTFKTDKFSTYAIVYSDVATGDGIPAALIVMLVLAGIVAGTSLIMKKIKAADGK